MSKFDKDIVKVQFTNSLNQVLNPGDKVVVVTSGYSHQVNITQGTYLGRYKTEDGPISCIVDRPRAHYMKKSNGLLHADSEMYGRINLIKYPDYRHYFGNHRYGSPEYQEAQIRYNDAQKAVQEQRKAIQDEYELWYESVYFRTTLKRNRVFKIDTAAWQMKI